MDRRAPLPPVDTRAFSVLLVDGDAPTLEATADLLGGGFDIMMDTSPVHALLLCRERLFHVVCASLVLPEMNGADFLREVAKLSSTSGRLLLSGADDYAGLLKRPSSRPPPLGADDEAPKLEPLFPQPPRAPAPSISNEGGPKQNVLLRPFTAEQLVSRVTALARIAEMKTTTRRLRRMVGDDG